MFTFKMQQNRSVSPVNISFAEMQLNYILRAKV